MTSPWIETYSGRKFYLGAPRSLDVHLPDIAHSLSRQVRFAGHTTEGYSIAEHSLWVWFVVSHEYPWDDLLGVHALLHDAAEAYIGDFTAPLKELLRDVARGRDNTGSSASPLDDIEDGVMGAILSHFGLEWPSLEQAAIVKRADIRMMVTERRSPALMPHTGEHRWATEDVEPYRGLLDGVMGLVPRNMIASDVWDGAMPDFVPFPSRLARFEPSEKHPVYRPYRKPLTPDDIAFLYEQSVLRLLTRIREKP